MKSKLLQTALVLGVVGGFGALTTSGAIGKATKPQSEIIPFVEENWVFIGGTEVVEHQGEKAIQLGVKQEGAPFGFGAAMLKRAPFTNGTIEYDVFFGETRTFAGLSFRAQDAENFENFYMRAHQSGNPDANQYMPNYNGIQSWQLYYGEQYSAPTSYSFNEWMHIKLVVSGELADVYIDDMSNPAMTVELKRDEKTGGIGLWALDLGGPAWFANFAATPMDSVEIAGSPVPEQPAGAGTVMSWQVSTPFERKSIEGTAELPQDLVAGLSFQTLEAEQTGISNLAKLHGVAPGADTDRKSTRLNSSHTDISRMPSSA